MAPSSREELDPEPVDEDDHGSTGRREGPVTALRQAGDAEARGHGRQHPVEAGGGRQERDRLVSVVRHRAGQRPMLEERSRANSMARSKAARPSASALIRNPMSSAAIVPS